MPDLKDTVREIRDSEVTFHKVHPLRLDRWHHTLVGLPEDIYMQLGGLELFNQVGQGAKVLLTILDLMGGELPMDHRELVRRNIQKFTWYAQTTNQNGDPCLVHFLATWLPEEQKWGLQTLRNAEDGPAILTDSLEAAVDEARKFAEGEG